MIWRGSKVTRLLKSSKATQSDSFSKVGIILGSKHELIKKIKIPSKKELLEFKQVWFMLKEIPSLDKKKKAIRI